MIVAVQSSVTRQWGSNSKPSTLKPLIEAADDIESDIESGDRSTPSK